MKSVSKSKNKVKKNKKKKKIDSLGFTLIELLATIAILSVVISIVVYFAMEIVNNAKNKGYQVTIANIEQEASSYVLEEIDKTVWVYPVSADYQYQCVTVQDLIDAGYFKGDVLNSKVSEDRNVLATDRVYLERDKTSKTITKNILLVEGYEGYASLCDYVPIGGSIDVSIPDGWSREKTIKIEYYIDKYSEDITYKYSYDADDDDDVVLSPRTFGDKKTYAEESLTVYDNGYITAEIRLPDVTITNTQPISGIDKVAPRARIDSTNEVSDEQKATLTMLDDESGVAKYYFGQLENPSDAQFIDGGNKESIIVDSEVNKCGKWYLIVIDAVENKTTEEVTFYETSLKVNNGSVNPNVIITMSGNSFNVPNGIPYSGYSFIGWYDSNNNYVGSSYKPMKDGVLTGRTSLINVPVEDITPPVITFDPNGSGWVKSISSVITATDSSGIKLLKVGYNQNAFYDFGGGIYGATKQSGDSHTFSGTTGTHYLHAYACDNNENCSEKHSNPFKIDATAPTVLISSTNNVASKQTVTLTLTDSHSGLASYSWGDALSQPTTNLSGNPENKTITETVSDLGSYVIRATDAVGNVSDKEIIKFYKTTLSVNNGSVSPNYVITKDGNSFSVPTPTANSGYKFVGWYNNSNFTGSPITIYTPTISTTLYAKLEEEVPKDTTKPTITFSPNGTNGEWKKSVSSVISVSDTGGSGINNSSLKYVFSTSSSTTPNTSFTNGESVMTPTNANGTYYLIATACDNENNCTTATSLEFKLDNTPPVIACYDNLAGATQYYGSNTATLGRTSGSTCSAYLSPLKTCKGSVSVNTTVLKATDSLSGLFESSISRLIENENGGTSLSQVACNCDDTWCSWTVTMTATDNVGNVSTKDYVYYLTYQNVVTIYNGNPTGCTKKFNTFSSFKPLDSCD